jgi:N-acetylneuraminic acid mutarotase
MPETRSDFSTCVIDGKIYAIGGAESPYGALRPGILVYDPMADTCIEKTQMPTPRIGVSANVVDGKIYAIGGATAGLSSVLRTVEVYDPATDTWTQKTNMPTARWGFGTAEVNAKIYAIGGASPGASGVYNTVECYDPVTDTWDTTKTDMPTGRRVFSANVLDGKIYAIGGVAGPQGSTYPLATMEEYNPALDPITLVEVDVKLPDKFTLKQNYPNPFNPTTTIKFSIPNVGNENVRSVKLIVYDMLGNEITTLVNEAKTTGIYEVEFDGNGLTSGIYFYQLKLGEYSTTKKMLLMK